MKLHSEMFQPDKSEVQLYREDKEKVLLCVHLAILIKTDDSDTVGEISVFYWVWRDLYSLFLYF